MIRTLFAGILLVLATALVLPWFVLWTALTGNPDAMYWTAMKFISFEMRFVGVAVRVEGLENIPQGACLFVANHVSNMDPMALLPILPRRVGILVKRELFRIPIFSTAMRRAQFVEVDRSGRHSITAAFLATVENLKKGFSYVIFPEGTRSPDGRLQSFKRGAFTMAIESGVPIVPVSIGGTHRILPKDKRIVRAGVATLRFGPPINASGDSAAERARLAVRVEAVVAEGLPADQKPA